MCTYEVCFVHATHITSHHHMQAVVVAVFFSNMCDFSVFFVYF